jgi:hypothetical protein
MFSIGGSTGIILSTNVTDIALHDSYYVVSHFHMVLSLGTINALFSGVSMLQDHLLSYLYLYLTLSGNSISISIFNYLGTSYTHINIITVFFLAFDTITQLELLTLYGTGIGIVL